MTAAQRAELVGRRVQPKGPDIERRIGRRREREFGARARLEDHGEQLEQGALAGTGFADERYLGAARNVEGGYMQPELGPAPVEDLFDVAKPEDRVPRQGSASNSSGYTESPSTGPPSSDTQRSTLSCKAL